jgi:hypothetical protein
MRLIALLAFIILAISPVSAWTHGTPTLCPQGSVYADGCPGARIVPLTNNWNMATGVAISNTPP